MFIRNPKPTDNTDSEYYDKTSTHDRRRRLRKMMRGERGSMHGPSGPPPHERRTVELVILNYK